MRKLFVLLLVMSAAGLLTTTGSAAAGSTGGSAATTAACAAPLPGAEGRFGGIVSAMPMASTCSTSNTSDAARGNPPLLWWGGPVMGTASTGPITVTPIFWNPPGHGHPMNTRYKTLLTQYLSDVAAASGTDTNVFSTMTEYYGSNGNINNQVQMGTPIDDRSPLPASGCTVASQDTHGIYNDGSGYNACLDDSQVTAEIQRIIDANNLPQNDYSHIYVLYTPKHVESCFYGGSTVSDNVCTINYQVTAGYCAYHSMMGDNWPDYGTVYANMPYPIYASPVGYTCGSDAGNFLGGLQTPNHNLPADTEISPTSHEIMESITDPNVWTGWYDAWGYENGDECAYVWGPTAGKFGQEYNQQINGHSYLTQEEFSNQDFFDTGGGCVQSESAVG